MVFPAFSELDSVLADDRERVEPCRVEASRTDDHVQRNVSSVHKLDACRCDACNRGGLERDLKTVSLALGDHHRDLVH